MLFDANFPTLSDKQTGIISKLISCRIFLLAAALSLSPKYKPRGTQKNCVIRNIIPHTSRENTPLLLARLIEYLRSDTLYVYNVEKAIGDIPTYLYVSNVLTLFSSIMLDVIDQKRAIQKSFSSSFRFSSAW